MEAIVAAVINAHISRHVNSSGVRVTLKPTFIVV